LNVLFKCPHNHSYAWHNIGEANPLIPSRGRKEVVIGVAAQDVQISGSMTGSHVGAYPLALLTDEGSPKSFFGALISGAVFFWVLFYEEK
jgi:hypothetical protein